MEHGKNNTFTTHNTKNTLLHPLLETHGKTPYICEHCCNVINYCHKSIFDEDILELQEHKDINIVINKILLYFSLFTLNQDTKILEEAKTIEISKKDKKMVDGIIYYHIFSPYHEKNICNISYKRIYDYIGSKMEKLDGIIQIPKDEQKDTYNKLYG